MTTTTALAEKVVSAKDMNIVGDGKTMNTKAIQKAIESYQLSEETKIYLRSLKISKKS